MPEATTVWLVSSPLSHAADRDEMLSDLAAQLDPSSGISSVSDAAANAGRAVARKATNSSSSSGIGGVSRVEFPEFKVSEEQTKDHVHIDMSKGSMAISLGLASWWLATRLVLVARHQYTVCNIIG